MLQIIYGAWEAISAGSINTDRNVPLFLIARRVAIMIGDSLQLCSGACCCLALPDSRVCSLLLLLLLAGYTDAPAALAATLQ